MSSITSVSPRTLADVIPGGLVRRLPLMTGGAGLGALSAGPTGWPDHPAAHLELTR